LKEIYDANATEMNAKSYRHFLPHD